MRVVRDGVGQVGDVGGVVVVLEALDGEGVLGALELAVGDDLLDHLEDLLLVALHALVGTGVVGVLVGEHVIAVQVVLQVGVGHHAVGALADHLAHEVEGGGPTGIDVGEGVLGQVLGEDLAQARQVILASLLVEDRGDQP